MDNNQEAPVRRKSVGFWFGQRFLGETFLDGGTIGQAREKIIKCHFTPRDDIPYLRSSSCTYTIYD